MIEVIGQWQGDPLTLGVRGHANFAPAGQDLICAGITALVYGLGQTVQEAAEQGLLAWEPEILLSHGQAKICAQPKPVHREALRGAFQMAINGAKLLASHYPNHVSVLDREKGEA